MGKHVDVQAFKEQVDINVNVDYEKRLSAAKERLIEVKKAEESGKDSKEVVVLEE